MAKINWDAIDEAILEAESFSGGSNSQVIRAYKLTENTEHEFRILPPLSNLGGKYFLNYTLFMFGNTPYVSLEAYGEECPLLEEYTEAKALADKGDVGMKKLLKKWDAFKVKKSYLLSVLQIEVEEDGTINIVDDKCKILEVGKGIFLDIHKIFANPKLRKAGGNMSITDRAKGMNVILNRERKKNAKGEIKTAYLVTQDIELSNFSDSSLDKYYSEEEGGIPDLQKYLKQFKKSPEYLRSVIRNYFYGEELLEDDSSDTEEETPTAKPTKTVAVTAKVTKGVKKATPPKKAAKVVKKTTDSNSSSLLDAIDDLEDE